MRATAIVTSLALVMPSAAPAAAQTGGRMYDPNTSPPSQLVSCQSQGGRYEECRLPGGTQSVQIAQQFSREPCIEGQTWGQRGDRVWVANGCRASFQTIQYGGYPGTPNPPYPGTPSPPPYPGQGSGAYAGQLDCDARFGERYCAANTGNRVDVLRVSSGQCQPGRDWTYDERGIRVRNGCRATFGYGFANTAGPTYPPYPGQAGQGGYAQVVTCQSNGFRGNTCAVNTQNRVELVQLLGGQCVQGRDWTFDARAIRVSNNCSAQFGVGYAGAPGQSGGGVSTGAVIAGAAVAAGLIALLASRGKNNRPGAGAAAIDADYNAFPRDAQREARACLAEAARQVGATGGQRIALARVDGAFREAGGWRLLARLTGAYSDRATDFTMTCTATGDRVTSFDVR